MLTDEIRARKEMGFRLYDLRQEKALTQEALSEISGLSVNAIALIESGKADAKATSIRKLATALHCSTDYLLLGTASEPHDPIADQLKTVAQKAARNLDRKKLVIFTGQAESLYKLLQAM